MNGLVLATFLPQPHSVLGLQRYATFHSFGLEFFWEWTLFHACERQGQKQQWLWKSLAFRWTQQASADSEEAAPSSRASLSWHGS